MTSSHTELSFLVSASQLGDLPGALAPLFPFLGLLTFPNKYPFLSSAFETTCWRKGNFNKQAVCLFSWLHLILSLTARYRTQVSLDGLLYSIIEAEPACIHSGGEDPFFLWFYLDFLIRSSLGAAQSDVFIWYCLIRLIKSNLLDSY